jgi:competence protein ComFB
MAFINEYNFENLKNEAETVVIKDLGRQLEAYPDPICKCNDCILDMAAMALNTVRPLYRVSLLGKLYTESAMAEGGDFARSVRVAVFDAIEKIRKNPSHEVNLENV